MYYNNVSLLQIDCHVYSVGRRFNASVKTNGFQDLPETSNNDMVIIKFSQKYMTKSNAELAT